MMRVCKELTPYMFMTVYIPNAVVNRSCSRPRNARVLRQTRAKQARAIHCSTDSHFKCVEDGTFTKESTRVGISLEDVN